MIVHSQRLRIERTLSEGPDAAVYLARDLIGGEAVVLRRTTGSRKDQSAALLTQFRLLSRLSRSGFTEPEDLVVTDGRVCGYTTAFVDSPSLSEVLQEGPSPELMIPFLRELSVALAYLHSLGYIHCDLKPENVLLRRDGDALVPCVLDLGLAVQQGTGLPTEWRGTPGYLAPEVVHGDRLTTATDVYSFGVILQSFLEHCPDGGLSARMGKVADECSRARPGDRPQTFWQVLDHLDQLSRRPTPARAAPTRLLPPLRLTGLKHRLAAVERAFSAQPSARMGLIGGPPGIGKSTLLRESCLRAQINGTETLRIAGIEDADDLDIVCGVLPADARLGLGDGTQSSALVVVEMAAGASIPESSLASTARHAREGRARLLIEHRGIPPLSTSREWVVFAVPPLGARECTYSTSHLVNNPALASVHGRAVATATGGIPTLVTHAMAAFLKTPHRIHAEPLDFDRLPPPVRQYWEDRLADTSAAERAVLESASLFHRAFSADWLATEELTLRQVHFSLAHLIRSGWLVEVKTQDRSPLYSFAARSARNVLRQTVGEGRLRFWAKERLRDSAIRAQLESVGSLEVAELLRLAGSDNEAPPDAVRLGRSTCPEDVKLRLLLCLCDYRRRRGSSEQWPISRYRALAEGFRQLGSPRRSRRWAARALRYIPAVDRVTAGNTSIITDVIALSDLAGDPVWKAQWLERAITSIPNLVPTVRGYLLSERGATFLVRTDPIRAAEDFLSAETLLRRHAPESEGRARNLSRLGVAEAMAKKRDRAQEHLEQALALAQRLDLDDVIWRAAGNLGWLAWSQGDPKTALDYHRRAAVQGKRDNSLMEYLLALSNIVICLVELGRGYGARQAACLAFELAEIISDPVQLGHTANNLGFVLAMQGGVGAANGWFAVAIRAREQIGDRLGAARSQLNIARTYAVARLTETAQELCGQCLRRFESLGNIEGVWDCRRLLARLAIEAGRYDEADRRLALIPESHADMPATDRVEVELLRTAVALWTGDADEAARRLQRLEADRLTAAIHGLRCDFLRERGHWHLLSGRFDDALSDLSEAAREERRGSRTDKLIDTLTVLALLARRMKSYSIGLRYLRTAEEMVTSMQTELT